MAQDRLPDAPGAQAERQRPAPDRPVADAGERRWVHPDRLFDRLYD